MKKTIFLLGLVGTMMAWNINIASAQDITDRYGIGFRLSAVSLQEDEVLTVPIELKNVPMFGVNLTSGTSFNFSMEASIDYIKTDMESEIEEGELTIIPLMLTIQYRFIREELVLIKELIVPYLGVGVGYYFNSFDESDYNKSQGVSIWVDNTFGFHIAMGFDYFTNENLAVNLDAKYFTATTDIKSTLGGVTAKDGLHLDSWIIGVGIKYYFY